MGGVSGGEKSCGKTNTIKKRHHFRTKGGAGLSVGGGGGEQIHITKEIDIYTKDKDNQSQQTNEK